MDWTTENFGARQASAYAALIDAALDRLKDDPFAAPSKNRDDDIGAGFRTLHVARPGRHLLLYRVEGTRILIVRILHDSMELSRHLPPDE
jgi:toxin ParE1/3/4